ncbi:hypothetical protein LR48_Vigan05g076800 [Vigna angularis]|uniref:BRCT domain-containing protein n=1 Tax=Phaseolus angularis TaxID=3914 RepID=A0A0L9UKS5_PHAAN|nr:hypothetical protein LR48_Vigan05g076800 [Vigna angularis]
MGETSSMATLAFRPPHFSEEVAWLPCWLQSLGTNGSIEFVKESQAHSYKEAKDPGPSEETGNAGEDFNAMSREEGRYRSCHLFLSGDDSSPLSVASSPENVFHFSLRLSSDIGSLFCPTQDLNESQDVVAPSTVLSLQAIQPSIDFRENMHSRMDRLTCESDLPAAFIPETVEKDASKSLVDTIDSVKGADVSNAIELSVAASEALVIHDLVKLDSVLETMRTEAVLEVALRVKQARLEGLEDGFQSSNEESDYSDSLSDLNDFIMEDAYEDIGLPIGVPIENTLCSSTIFETKGVSDVQEGRGSNNKNSDGMHASQLHNFDDKSKQKQLEVNVEKEMQQNADSPHHSLRCEKETHFDDPGLGENTLKHFDNSPPIFHQCIGNSTDVVAPNQTVGLTVFDLTSIKPPNSVNSSLVEISGNFIPVTAVKPSNTTATVCNFKSGSLGGVDMRDPPLMTSTFPGFFQPNFELDSSSLKGKNAAEWIPNFLVRETSFHTESVDIVPDEHSRVLKHDPNCAIGSQLSVPSEDSHNKANESILQSQDVIRCSSPSLNDPLCSFVPCSLSLEHANYNTHIDKGNDYEDFVPSVFEFEVDNFQRISGKKFNFDRSDEKVTSVLDDKDLPITEATMDEQVTRKLARVEHTSLKTYSTILPNYNLTALPIDENMGSAASLGTKISESLSASKHADGNKYKEDNQHLVDHKSIIEIINDKCSNELKPPDENDITAEPTQDTPLILNHRIRRCFLGPMNFANDVSAEEIRKEHVVPETVVQNQQNNTLNELQFESNKFPSEHVRVRKKVHFSEKVEGLHPKRKVSKLESSHKRCSSVRAKRQRVSKSLTNSVPSMKHSLTNYCRNRVNEYIFQGIEFLLTGLSSEKERDMEALIRSSGGVVLFDIPSQNSGGKRHSTLSHFPIVLCMRKLQTTKFLYGCAVGASILKVDWLIDCVVSGTILKPENIVFGRRSLSGADYHSLLATVPVSFCDDQSRRSRNLITSTRCHAPRSLRCCFAREDHTLPSIHRSVVAYLILPNRNDMKWSRIGTAIHPRNQRHIFERVRIMLHGKPSFCTKLACIIKHGGGHVFKTLQGLVRIIDVEGTWVEAIVVEDKATISRHLKHCAQERNIPMMPFSWIIKSLYSGKLLPFTEKKTIHPLPFVKVSELPSSSDMSQEI